MVVKLKVNYENENLWCIESKDRIEIGEKYVEIDDPEDEGIKTYKFEFAPIDNDHESPY